MYLVNSIKYGVCLIFAICIGLGLFLFMQKLISQPIQNDRDLVISGVVTLFKPVEDILPDIPEPEATIPEPEIVKDDFDISPESMDVSQDITFDGTVEGLTGFDIGFAEEGILVAVADDSLKDFANDTREGVIDITPFATRKPNIPQKAYDNQLSGWVTVIFNLDENGYTRSIQILDAQPKGIFEQEVVRAVSRWRYNTQGLVTPGKDVVLTQRIQLDWRDFPKNLPYHD